MLPPASCSLPGTVTGVSHVAGRAAPRSCLALLRVGFALPPLLPAGRCALTATVSPLPVLPAGAIGGLFSVALSVALRRPAVSRHPALRSSDFPRRSQAAPRSSLASRPVLSNSAQERTRTSTPVKAPDP